MNTLGDQIRSQRKALGWSLDDLARHAGLSKTMVWRGAFVIAGKQHGRTRASRACRVCRVKDCAFRLYADNTENLL